MGCRQCAEGYQHYSVHPITNPTLLRFTDLRWSVQRHGIPVAVHRTHDEATADANARDAFRRFNT
jgi:hypothetical protein